MTINKQELKNFFWGLQDEITKAVSAFDGNPFIEDIWAGVKFALQANV